MYNLLYHNALDLKSVEALSANTLTHLQQGDFKSADVRKMVNTGFYRARLNGKDRLLFAPVKHQGKTHLLLLELIKDHNYARSRFLRGATLPDDDHLLPVPAMTDSDPVKSMPYLNPKGGSIHVLNKFISFDEVQAAVMTLPPPLIIIGSAGSGKTALVLEKMKALTGSIAYVSLSKFLVESASKMYYAHGYENEDQDAEFLSLADYLAGWQKPEGQEVNFRAFEQWFARHEQALKIHEPYRVYEEFKGVITGSPVHAAWLSQEEYLQLGVKQSVFSPEERERLYPLFQKYLEWLRESRLYDSNVHAFQCLEKIAPRYDYLIVDEVQDITNIQLKSILQSLTRKTDFILTGDSNQIVHPNFFSWSKVKSYFYHTGDGGSEVKILQTNYRNSPQVVELSNRLLKIKNSRFGSIDRESNYLINTISANQGEVLLYPDDEKKKNELNRRTQESKDFAVIVSDTIYKNQAASYFKTPLVFSIQEAKGLEYENVILVNFVSNHENEFREIIRNVTSEDLQQQELLYNRAADKQNKDAEVYKFYINSLYVAITRAIKNIYLFESRISHPVFELLQLRETRQDIQVAKAQSTREEWLEEARKLKEQGKFEQAEQILARFLGYEYLSPERLEVVCQLALDPAKKESEVKKERKQLFDYAVHHQRYDWIDQLAKLQLARAVAFMKEVRHHRKEYAKSTRLGRMNEAMATIKKFGLEFTTDEESTGLMLALHHDHKDMATELIRMGASVETCDRNGNKAAHYLLQGYFKKTFLKQPLYTSLGTLKMHWYTTRPTVIRYEVAGRRFQVNSHSMLYFLATLMQAVQPFQQNKIEYKRTDDDTQRKVVGVFHVSDLTTLAAAMPEEILPEYRKQRQYINAVLASNEVSQSDKTACRFLFRRTERGWYVLNPEVLWLAVE